jgi:hypothetical protein
MKPTWCTFHSIYWESGVSICFEHYLLILRRRDKTTLGILRAYNVSWVCHDGSETVIVAQPTDTLNIACKLLYCNHQARRDFLITLYICVMLDWINHFIILTLYLLTWKIWWAPNNASKWQMGFNSAFKGLILILILILIWYILLCM